MASCQSCTRVINTRMTLSTTGKGNLTIAQYVEKMKPLADDMASAGRKLDDEDLVGYILSRLDSDFDSVISVVTARVEPISMSLLYGQAEVGASGKRVLHRKHRVKGAWQSSSAQELWPWARPWL
jgi:hypothetical protein